MRKSIKLEKENQRRSTSSKEDRHQLIFLWRQRDRHQPSCPRLKQPACFQRYQRLIKSYHTQAVLSFLYGPGMIPTTTTNIAANYD
ncbi:hypothetical protein BDQ94DRAFT_148343 [Aspergillus welwitschiae]|uniref:Uncharacterized protein n=1 Tax=Aspergillus welwitschiae TaxID=1341132 RepID=A0A3F3PWJ8_9EURO|nr:hypothetical protein BDQ94DRAFT_148343 [Aspergillus welwitschiae]RDH30686.1 hypothetical protein BDQ94DRAFT_148343 [Aspergillus welwitschiae]